MAPIPMPQKISLFSSIEHFDTAWTAVMNAFGDWTVILDGGLKIVHAQGNPPKAALSEKRFFSVFQTEDSSSLQLAFDKALRGETSQVQWRHFQNDGSLVSYDSVVIPQDPEREHIVMVSRSSHPVPVKPHPNDQQQLLDILMNSIPQLIYVRNHDGTIRQMNDYFCKVLSLGAENFIGQNMSKLPLGAMGKELDNHDQSVMKTGLAERVELNLKGNNKKPFLFDMVKIPLKNALGQTTGLVAIGRNISKERKYEERFQVAIDVISEIMLDWDFDARHLHFSNLFYDLMHYERGIFDGSLTQCLYRLIPKEDRLDLIQSIRLFTETLQETYEKEIRIKDKTGKYRWFIARAKATSFTFTGQRHALIFLIEISNLKNLQLDLKNYNYQLDTLISTVPGIVFTARLDTRFSLEYISDKCKEITGYASTSFLLNKINIRSLIVESDRDQVIQTIRNAASYNMEYEIKYRIYNREGKEIWVWEKGVFLPHLEEGKEPLFEGIIMDITELVRMEDRLLSATLAAEDRERKRLALELHDGVQQVIVSSLFHFKSLQEHHLGKLDKEMVESFEEGLSLLMHSLEEIRAISHNIMPKSIYDLGLVSSVEGLIARIQKGRGPTVDFFENLNDYRLAQNIELNVFRLIQESINNILKYAKAQEIWIEIYMKGGILEVTIEDNGIGFDTEVFNEFRHSFGLAAMKSRVAAIHGKFTLQSKVGLGTKISATIPLDLIT